jgi:putative molybdopterin biosynthesis protein
VYELIKRGELSCSKVGKQMRVSKTEVESYLLRTMGGRRPQDKPFESTQPAGSRTAAPPAQEDLLRGNELIVCGQDVSLDILVSYLNSRYEGIPIYRSHLGSYNGIYALYQGKVNVATAHLWDGDEDTYNMTYVRKMMPGIPAVIIRIGRRKAGLYVREGNPNGLIDWSDLARPGLVLANREKGSGARVLLDEKLRLMGVPGETIAGYFSEFKTHLAVASQVSAGLADAGIGSEKGCQGLTGVTFVPLQTECYDLIIRKSDITKPQFSAILEIATSEDYKRDIQKAAGFDISQTGKFVGN